MKRFLLLSLTILMLVMPNSVQAGDSDIDLSLLGGVQSDFKELSRELGLATAYKPTAPAEALGILGFDVGIEMTFADIDNDSSYWSNATGDVPGILPVPKLHAIKGLPFNIDVGAMYSKVPSSDISLLGAELKWAFIEGGVVTPAVAVRGAYTKLDGVDGLDFNTKSLDVSVSKGFTLLTPYAGIGKVWIESDPTGVPALQKEDISETKMFAGLKISLALLKIVAEYELAEIPSYSLKLSLGF